MLAATGWAVPPAARMAATVVSSEPSSGWSPSRTVRAAQTTRPPSAAKSRAISAPMPRLAPVTTTTLSLSLGMARAVYSPPGEARTHGGETGGQSRGGAGATEGDARARATARARRLHGNLLSEPERRSRAVRSARGDDARDSARDQHREHLHASPVGVRADRRADPRAR